MMVNVVVLEEVSSDKKTVDTQTLSDKQVNSKDIILSDYMMDKNDLITSWIEVDGLFKRERLIVSIHWFLVRLTDGLYVSSFFIIN